jgi:hypothetical protein
MRGVVRPQSTLMVDVSHHCGVVRSHQDMSSLHMWKEGLQGQQYSSSVLMGLPLQGCSQQPLAICP